jgi:D-sedoheptulose 7-phosphate isomerase
MARMARERNEPGGRAGVSTSLGAERLEADGRFFGAESERIARLCHRMAERFARGGRLLALARSPRGWSDARHVAVEFVHPVIVGKRALPALALAPEELDALAEPEDMVIAFDPQEDLALASARGCLTIAFCPDTAADWVFVPATTDPFVSQELAETLYHFLWEHVHVFFEHRGLLEGRHAKQVHDSGASSFLYPFLGEQETDLDAVLDDVRRSVLMKAQEIAALREQTLSDGRETLAAAASDLRAAFAAGGRLLALGNGGSATDAMDAVADFRSAEPSRGAIDLTADSAILTAIANDIGTEAIFARQVIAYGRAGDVLLALSTSGNSDNVIAALAEARRRDIRTIAMVGYDGGRVAAESLADHVVVTRSEHIPRIQEAQASAYHMLRELVVG